MQKAPTEPPSSSAPNPERGESRSPRIPTAGEQAKHRDQVEDHRRPAGLAGEQHPVVDQEARAEAQHADRDRHEPVTRGGRQVRHRAGHGRSTGKDRGAEDRRRRELPDGHRQRVRVVVEAFGDDAVEAGGEHAGGEQQIADRRRRTARVHDQRDAPESDDDRHHRRDADRLAQQQRRQQHDERWLEPGDQRPVDGAGLRQPGGLEQVRQTRLEHAEYDRDRPRAGGR